jgi:hypothetical protein
MIIVTCIYKKNMTEHSFPTLTEALVFARNQHVGVSYQIREGTSVLAKGKIEELKDGFNY